MIEIGKSAYEVPESPVPPPGARGAQLQLNIVSIGIYQIMRYVDLYGGPGGVHTPQVLINLIARTSCTQPS